MGIQGARLPLRGLKAGIHEQQKQTTKQKQATKTLFFTCDIPKNICFQLFLVFGKHVFVFGLIQSQAVSFADITY